MADVDLSGWPIVAVRIDDIGEPAELAALLGAVTSALERRQPFGLLIASDAVLAERDSVREPLRWLRRRRAEIGAWCSGIIYVLPFTVAERFAQTGRPAARRLWGCDVDAVHDPEAARAWLLARLVFDQSDT